VAIVATGSVLKLALDFASEQEPEKRPSVFSMPLIKPLSNEFIEKLCKFKILIALEEHVKEGGLFASLCETLPPSCRIYSCFIPEDLKSHVGSQNYLRNKAKLKEKLNKLTGSILGSSF
jgi:transketolase C-terminal domain/subunit